MHDVYPLLKKTEFPDIFRGKLSTVQINLGYKCNQTCLHCHVNAGPKRKELMTLETINQIIEFIKKFNIKIVDLTGGAPELNPHFDFLVKSVKKLNCHVIDRCNLTVLLEPNKSYLFSFFKKNNIEIIASLPCYQEKNVDAQRGNGVFKKSIKVLQKLNKIGYGLDKNLKLNLVYNPQGPTLPPNQKSLESSYKKYLFDNYGILFRSLFTITNMPIARFGSTLISKGSFNSYMELLKKSFSSEALKHVMCKSMISIDYLGYVYDCDFNQMLGINLSNSEKKHISIINKLEFKKRINIANHCYGCTAGAGSSCGGSLL